MVIGFTLEYCSQSDGLSQPSERRGSMSPKKTRASVTISLQSDGGSEQSRRHRPDGFPHAHYRHGDKIARGRRSERCAYSCTPPVLLFTTSQVGLSYARSSAQLVLTTTMRTSVNSGLSSRRVPTCVFSRPLCDWPLKTRTTTSPRESNAPSDRDDRTSRLLLFQEHDHRDASSAPRR